MGAGEFWSGWRSGFEEDEFVRYPREALQKLRVPPEDCEFLADAGLPAWAAPHMHFVAPRGAELPAPEEPYGAPYPGAVSGLGMIGSVDDGWPLCVDQRRPGAVVWLHPQAAPDGLFVNSSSRQLAATLRCYNRAVEEALAEGDARGEDDAWRRGLYSPDIDRRLWQAIRSIDPAAASGDGFWAARVRYRPDDT